MGRYLSSGVLTSIFIKKSKDIYHRDANFDLKKQKENILKDMNRIIDVSKYDVEEHEDVIVLKLKLDFINENIHALLSEMNHLTTSAYFFENFYDYDEAIKIDFDDPDFKKKYPMLCTIEDGYYTIKCNDKSVTEQAMFDDFYWFIQDDYLCDNVVVSGAILVLWFDFNKYVGENQTPMLRVLNNLKTTYYHNELAKALVYEIFG